MAIAVTLDLRVQSGKGGELVDVLKSMLGATRARQGAKSIELVVNQEDSDHVVIYEVWDTKADHEAYMAWRGERGDLDALSGFVASPPTVTYYDIADPA